MAASHQTQRLALVLRALDSIGKAITANNLFQVLPREAFPTRRVLRDEVLRAGTAAGLVSKAHRVLAAVPRRPRDMHRRNPHYVYTLNKSSAGSYRRVRRVCARARLREARARPHMRVPAEATASSVPRLFLDALDYTHRDI